MTNDKPKTLFFWILITLWSVFVIFLAGNNVYTLIKLESEIISVGSASPNKQVGKIYPIVIKVNGYHRSFYVDKNYSMRRKKAIYIVTAKHVLYILLNLIIYCALRDKFFPVILLAKSKKFDILEYLSRPLLPKI